ncbi:MAG: 30S ribosomal protein S2 [Candidatus Margulisbacteria bacterium]|nr:30S ribosomal protein S2 [Candidatus Margulisiibacteriota bacterium]
MTEKNVTEEIKENEKEQEKVAKKEAVPSIAPKKIIPEKVVSMRQLLETGVHFGHQTRRWNPKMKPYIYTSRNDIHVIDLQKTLVYINKAYDFIKEKVSKGATILFIGTKKQAQSAIEEEAKRCGMPYVSNRWLGGMLTNFETIKKSVNRMKEIETWKENGLFDSLAIKEQSVLSKKCSKIQFHLNGMREMVKLPDIVFIVDTKKEEIAVHEANVLKIPIVGIVDTNCDPDLINHPIPANDDAIRTIKLLASIIANAVLEGKKLLPVTGDEAITKELENVLVSAAPEASVPAETAAAPLAEEVPMDQDDFEKSLELQEMYEDMNVVED